MFFALDLICQLNGFAPELVNGCDRNTHEVNGNTPFWVGGTVPFSVARYHLTAATVPRFRYARYQPSATRYQISVTFYFGIIFVFPFFITSKQSLLKVISSYWAGMIMLPRLSKTPYL